MLRVGTDIVEIARIQEIVGRRPAFWDRILSSREKDYCLKKGNPVSSLAGRFAAKEAVLKCLGTGLSKLSWRDIEILNNDRGAPSLVAAPRLEAEMRRQGLAAIQVSISHSRAYAMAVAVGEERTDEDFIGE